MVIKLTTAAAAIAETDTDKLKGMVLYRMFLNFPSTMGRISPMLPMPVKMPMGMPIAPMQSPSNSTEFRSCFAVAPTDERIPNWRVRSFSEMLNEL